jgi:RND family efflux transporter MFP subunit
MRSLSSGLVLALAVALPVAAADLTLAPREVTEWKAVYGRIEARTRLPARARIGGTLVSLNVAEGDMVAAGDPLGVIVDEKIAFQLAAVDAQLSAITSQLANAQAELTRGEELLARGATTVQRLDGLRTQVDVLANQIEQARAQRRVIEQQAAEGTVLAPISGRVLTVPAAAGAVVMPGEPVATLGGNGFFLRLAVPERHLWLLTEGDAIEVSLNGQPLEGTLSKLYPQVENGRVIADVGLPDLSSAFVDARVLVRLPVGRRDALMVPAAAVDTRRGLDFVTLRGEGARVVVPGEVRRIDGVEMVEILSGLKAGDVVVTP